MTKTWKVEFDEKAIKELRKLDGSIQKKILKYLRENIATDQDPERFGKALVADKKGLWRYRIEGYRIICRIEKEKVIVLVLALGHRKEIYD